MNMHLTVEVFEVIGITLLAAAVLGALFHRFRQPVVIAFILVGIVLGPSGLSVASGNEIIPVLAEIGIAVLLFVVGLKLDVDEVRGTGATVAVLGLLQMAVTAAAGFAGGLALGFDLVGSVYIALAMAFSSTIIVVKMLSDRRELDSLHGRIAVGVLIVQDVAVILAMIVVTSLGAADSQGPGLLTDLLVTAATGIGFVAAVLLVSRLTFARLLSSISRSGELLVLFAVAWAVSLAGAAEVLGFGKEIGAFVAGVSLASTPFREGISMRLASLRDFLLLFFFLDLGMRLDLSAAMDRLPAAVVLTVIVTAGTPVLVTAIMGRMGYRRMTGFFTGLALAQISEFSLILTALGVSYGHIGDDVLGVVTMVALLTIAASTYLMRFAAPLYNRLARPLKAFQVSGRRREDSDEEGRRPAEAIVFGLGRYGDRIAEGLVERGVRVLGVDFDPRVVRRPATEHMHYTYGDVENPDLPAHLPLAQARVAVSTVPLVETNRELFGSLRAAGFAGRFAATAHNDDDARELAALGVDVVLTPFADAADQAVDVLTGQDSVADSYAAELIASDREGAGV